MNIDKKEEYKVLCEELDTFVESKYGSSDEVFYDDYKDSIQQGYDFTVNHIGSINTAFDRASDSEKAGVMERLAKIHAILHKKDKTEVGDAIQLRYNDNDFGTLAIEPAYKGVSVTVTYKGDILILKSKKKFDFYLQDRTRDTIFRHIKDELEVADYNAFLAELIPRIEDVIYPKTEIEETKTEEKAFDTETIAKARELIHSPTLLFEIKQFLSKWGKYREEGVWKKKKPIVGEDGNKLHVTCSCLSALYSEKINDLVLGKSSVGKTRLVSIPSLLFGDRTEDLAGMTEASPKNIEEDLDGKIFVLKEIEGSANAEYYLKILFDPEAEDMKVRTSEKDPETNRYTSVVRQTRGKPVGITTTALPKYGIEFRNRFSLLQLDESEEQTRLIKEREMVMKQELPEDLTEEVAKFRCAFSLLQPIEVKIPFNVFYPSDEVEARRAFKRLLTLIEVITLLHQYQRETTVGEDGITYLKATITDFYYAYTIAEASIGMDVQGLTENAMKLYRTLDECETKNDKKEWLINEIHTKVRTELGLKWHKDTLRGYLNELQDESYVISYEDKERRGHPYIYSLREKELKNVSFCRFFVENPDQQKKLFINAIEDAARSDGLIDSVEQKDTHTCIKEEIYKCIIRENYINMYNGSFNRKIEDEQGLVVFNPISEKIELITSSDAEILEYIYKYSYISGSTDQQNNLTPENTPNGINERLSCRADGDNKTKHPDTPTEDGDSQSYLCICGASFSTIEELRIHNSRCDIFQQAQSSEVKTGGAAHTFQKRQDAEAGRHKLSVNTI